MYQPAILPTCKMHRAPQTTAVPSPDSAPGSHHDPRPRDTHSLGVLKPMLLELDCHVALSWAGLQLPSGDTCSHGAGELGCSGTVQARMGRLAARRLASCPTDDQAAGVSPVSPAADAMSGTASCDAVIFQGLGWRAAARQLFAFSSRTATCRFIGCCTGRYWDEDEAMPICRRDGE